MVATAQEVQSLDTCLLRPGNTNCGGCGIDCTENPIAEDELICGGPPTDPVEVDGCDFVHVDYVARGVDCRECHDPALATSTAAGIAATLHDCRLAPSTVAQYHEWMERRRRAAAVDVCRETATC